MFIQLTGPWRSLWVRFGYDPRKHPEAKIYQVLDFRIRCGMKYGKRAQTTETLSLLSGQSWYYFSFYLFFKLFCHISVLMKMTPSEFIAYSSSSVNSFNTLFHSMQYVFPHSAYSKPNGQLADVPPPCVQSSSSRPSSLSLRGGTEQ